MEVRLKNVYFRLKSKKNAFRIFFFTFKDCFKTVFNPFFAFFLKVILAFRGILTRERAH